MLYNWQYSILIGKTTFGTEHYRLVINFIKQTLIHHKDRHWHKTLWRQIVFNITILVQNIWCGLHILVWQPISLYQYISQLCISQLPFQQFATVLSKFRVDQIVMNSTLHCPLFIRETVYQTCLWIACILSTFHKRY